MSINKILADIQVRLAAPKDSKNSFGNYNYRSCESILKALKPLLHEHNSSVTLQDDIQDVGGRIYVKATATLTTGDGESVSVSAFAREAASKKGMDEAQVTGAASSYARKYALGGLFAIDDNADADRLNTGNHYLEPEPQPPQRNPDHTYNEQGVRTLNDDEFATALAWANKSAVNANKLLDPTQFALTPEQYNDAKVQKDLMEVTA